MKEMLFICHVTGKNGVKMGILVRRWKSKVVVFATLSYEMNFSRMRMKVTFSYRVFQDGSNAL